MVADEVSSHRRQALSLAGWDAGSSGWQVVDGRDQRWSPEAESGGQKMRDKPIIARRTGVRKRCARGQLFTFEGTGTVCGGDSVLGCPSTTRRIVRRSPQV